jgi:hypothetical protein
MIEPVPSERYTIHYQPIAGGTTNTMCVKAIKKEPDGTTIFRCISSSKRLQSSIRYEPNGTSKQITVSEKLKDNKHISPIKVNGIIRWQDYFEIHAYTVGWQTSTKLGKLALNIPGIEGVRNAQKKGMLATIEFEDSEDSCITCSYNRKNNIVNISVQEHPLLSSVSEIRYDDLDWFHNAYPFSDTSLGVRIGFKTDISYKLTRFIKEFEPFDYWSVSRRYEEQKTKNARAKIT